MPRGLWILIGALCSQSAPAVALSPKEVYKKCAGAVVLMLGSDDGHQGSGGTGSIISSDGKILTNAHVVLSHTTNQPFKILYVYLKPDQVTGDNSRDLTRRFKGRVLAFSGPDDLDLALVQLEEGPAGLSTLAFADPGKVDVGDEVVAIGHPEQGGLWTLTTGAISTVIANYGRVKGKDVFQTEASVNRGNSGGPLLDTDGNMVGINTMIARQAADGVAITAVNFSLKSSVAVSWLALQGMGLAYAPKSVDQGVALALAPRADLPGGRAAPTAAAPAVPQASASATRPVASNAAPAPAPAPAGPTATAPSRGSPPATAVVAQPLPARPAEVKNAALALQRRVPADAVVKGKPLDPAAKPRYVTPAHPFDLDDLRRQQLKDLENLMDEMRVGGGKSGSADDGMGVW